MLPLHAYCSPTTHAQELSSSLFSPALFGHVSFAEEPGDVFVPPHLPSIAILRDSDGELRIQSNTCLHRQALLCQPGLSCLDRLVCPVHHWSYSLDGTIRGTPNFTPAESRPLPLTLPAIPHLLSASGLLFHPAYRHPSDLALASSSGFFPIDDLPSLRFFKWGQSTINANWKDYIEIFLDNYHVASAHPGIRSLVDPASITWNFQPLSCYHRMDFNPSFFRSPASKTAAHYARLLKRISGADSAFPYGVCWALLFPNIILELYAGGFFFVTLVLPDSALTSTLHTYYFCPDDYPEALTDAFLALANETEAQDQVLLSSLVPGRRALYQADPLSTISGPTHVGYERGLVWFRDTYLAKLTPSI